MLALFSLGLGSGDMSELISCPDCGNRDDSDEFVGFTYPSNGKLEFVVCQCCGRRTLRSDWNDLKAKSIDELEQ